MGFCQWTHTQGMIVHKCWLDAHGLNQLVEESRSGVRSLAIDTMLATQSKELDDGVRGVERGQGPTDARFDFKKVARLESVTNRLDHFGTSLENSANTGICE
jgi:hypothetical protein